MGKQSKPGPRDSLDQYLAEISAYPVLTRREEVELGRRIRHGDGEAVRELVRGNLRFVVSVARRYRGRGVSLSDLVNEGNVGLVRAARRFDERRGVRFVTYAAWWVRQSVLEALRRQGELVSIPRSARTRGTKRAYVSLDAPRRPGRRPRVDRLADTGAPPTDRRVEQESLRDLVRRCLATLPRREARVLRLYFGLPDGRPAGLEEISRELGVSRDRVRQIRNRGLERLRTGPGGKVLAGHGGASPAGHARRSRKSTVGTDLDAFGRRS